MISLAVALTTDAHLNFCPLGDPCKISICKEFMSCRHLLRRMLVAKFLRVFEKQFGGLLK